MRTLVAIEDKDKAVVIVIPKQIPKINQAPSNPPFPTSHPWRRYIMTPKMVTMVGVKTPLKVDSFGDADMDLGG